MCCREQGAETKGRLHTFLQKDALKKRVLVTEHEAFIRCRAMSTLQVV